MATTITSLDRVPNKKEEGRTYNVSITDASAGVEIIAAGANQRYGIRSIDVCGNFGGTEWFKILDGTDVIIGPRILSSGVPWSKTFEDTVYGTVNTALIIQTESAVLVSLIIEVLVGL